jgi:DNA-binding CsgD family transcriptional regulator
MLCPRVVGRDQQLAWLGAALDRAVEGRGGCSLLVGEAGIGKSRLTAEIMAEAGQRGMTVLAGRATPTGTAVAYQPLTAAVLRALRSRSLEDIAGVEVLRPGLAVLLPGFVEAPAVLASPVLIGETVLRLAAAMSAGRGSLVVLEDLHWADADTLALMEYVADNLAGEPVALVGTSRPDAETLTVIDALHRRATAEVATLAPLTGDQTLEMARACLGDPGGDVQEAVMAVLEARAEGLPFLVEELLAGLANQGVLEATEAGWHVHSTAQASVPVSFAQSVRQRLADLGPAGLQVLEAAAVFGRDFDWSRLGPLVGLDEPVVLDALRRAIDVQLIERGGGDRFRFRHALTLDAVLSEMLAPVRARLASAAFDQLTGGSEPIAGRLIELAAHLATEAGRHTEACGHLVATARDALSAGAVTTAVVTARKARALVPDDSEDAVEADELLLSALNAAGDLTGVDQVGRRLVARLDETGASAERRATARLVLANAALAAGRPENAERFCEEALGLDLRDTRLHLQLDLALAEIAFNEHHHGAAAAAAAAVLARADAPDMADVACDALELLARYRGLVAADLAGAEHYLLASLARAERGGLPLKRLHVLYQLAQLDMARIAGTERMELARESAGEVGALGLVADIDHLLALACLNTGRLDAASESADRALHAARRYGLGELTAVAAGLVATIEAIRGHRQEAERQVGEALATADWAPQLRAAISGSALVVAALADDDLAAAATRVDETRALLRTLSPNIVIQPLVLGMFHALAAVVLAARGARELVEGPDWIRVDDVLLHNSFGVAQAIVAGRVSDSDRADELFRAADVELARGPWLQALYRRYAAEAALADGWGDPTVWLAEAEAVFEDSGNPPLARACRSLLGTAGVTPRRRPPRRGLEARSGPDLTTREADVLALVALGFTNKQIAARLYLSPRTVEKHVERILGKTGAPNRTALAAQAGEEAKTARPT